MAAYPHGSSGVGLSKALPRPQAQIRHSFTPETRVFGEHLLGTCGRLPNAALTRDTHERTSRGAVVVGSLFCGREVS